MAKQPKDELEQLLAQNNELLRKQLIIKLAEMKVAQQSIRAIVGGNLNYINRIVKQLKVKAKDGKR